MAAKFYDHCKNQTNPNVAHAMARARRDCLADGTAMRVEANWPGQERFYWTGCPYDVKRLASDLRNAENVVVTMA